MKIDFNAILYGLDEIAIKKDADGDEPATLGFVVKQVLLAGKDDEKMDAAKKVRLFELAMTVADSMKANEPAELEVEDVALIKERAAPLPVGILGPMFKLLK